MDKLNQAFMKAYSKQQASQHPRRAAPAEAEPVRPTPLPDGDTRTASVPLTSDASGAKQWRVDFPICTADDRTFPAARPHAIFSPVEHVESYDLDTIWGPQAGRVVLEDRIAPQELLTPVHRDPDPDPDQEQANRSSPEGVPSPQDVVILTQVEETVADDARQSTVQSPSRNVADPSRWEFELNVQRADVGLDEVLHETPIVALKIPTDLDPRAYGGVVATFPWTTDPDLAPESLSRDEVAARQGDPESDAMRSSQGRPCEMSTTPPEAADAPALVARSTREITPPGDGDASPPMATLPSSVATGPAVDPTEVPADDPRTCADTGVEPVDAESPEQLNHSAKEMDAAPSVPFPEPAWGVPNDANNATITGREPVSAPFTAAWEVDAFHWPELCMKLEQAVAEPLAQAGEALRDASRDDLRTLAVTSAQRREGRTAMALTLARAAARAGAKVALLDMDLANPDLARQLGVEAPCSWSDSAARGEPLSESAVYSVSDQITLFPLICPLDDLHNGLADERLTSMLQRARAEFDLVVLDMHPVTDRDTGAFHDLASCPIDMAIVVRNVHVTPAQETLAAIAHLRTMGVAAIGVAENFATPAAC